MGAVRTAVVGLGTISFEHLAKLRDRDDVEVVGLCDLHERLAEAVSERFGLGAPYTDFARMLDETRPDVVHVLAPPQAHHQLTMQALQAGAHVLVEKPVATTWGEYAEMRDLARERGLLLCENYNCRFEPAMLAALEAWRAGRIGETVNVDVSYGGVMGANGPYSDREVVHFAHALPGGALYNFISHPVSMALPFMDACAEVVAVRRRLDGSFASDDELRAVLTGERTSGVVTVSRHAAPHLKIEVQGTHGSLSADVYTGKTCVSTEDSVIARGFRDGLEGLRAGATMTAKKLSGRHDGYAGLGTLLDRYYDAVGAGGAPPVTEAEMDAVNGVIRDIFSGSSR
ncbi:MAG: oxidoreductase domain protein [Solirubrobacterales bacterium]|jgi:predicted dehydrogenase|nr:oxidoreductase domain protein [Solirubrobacterales bacterium]